MSAARFIVAYWIESPSPYLVVDTQPMGEGPCKVIGGFTDAVATQVAAALNEKGRADAIAAELYRQAAELDEARAESTDLRTVLVGLLNAINGVARGEFGIDDIKADRVAAAKALTGTPDEEDDDR